MKKIIRSLILTFILSFAFITKVNAAGTITASFTGSNSVTVGSNVSLNVNVSSVTGSSDGKMYSLGGYISYDPEYLEYVSFSGSNGFTGSINTANHKVSLVDYGLSTGSAGGNIGTVKFKALKTGSTSVTMTSPTGTDMGANLTVTFNAKSITINEPAPVVKSNNSKLDSLSVTGFTIEPTFNGNVTSYTLEVPNDTDTIKVNAHAEDSKATVTGTGTKTLTDKITAVTVVVKAEDGSETTYTINVTKADKKDVLPDKTETKNSDSSLKKLDVSGYTLTPVFQSGVTSYSMKVSNNITTLDVTAVPTYEKSKVSITGNKGWQVGNNVISIKVTAEDGSSTTYIVNVNRAAANVKSSDTNIDLRILSSHTIKPEFNNSINSYDVSVPYDVTKLNLSITPYDKTTKYTVEGNENFKVGEENIVLIKVTAQDGSNKTIKLNVTRTKEKVNTDLLDLQVVGHTLSPLFKPSITDYKVNVKSNEDELELIIKTAEGAHAEVSGNGNFVTGKNMVLIKVTDENGYVKYYTIEVNKAKKKFTIFGLLPITFFMLLGLILLLLLLLLLLFLLLRKKKDKEIVKEVTPIKPDTPLNIEFKPEFNFGSKNGTDDDTFYSNGGAIVNGSGSANNPKALPNVKEEVYDIYDDVVTKDELIDAINETIETRNPEKLKLLLDQEALNRRKEELRRKEEEKDNY